jgi:iron complex outermembrane receptor protein
LSESVNPMIKVYRLVDIFLLMIFLTGVCLPVVGQNKDDVVSTDTLKKLSMEELLNLEVMSVSRRQEKLVRAASAIQVITQEDFTRYGATSIPEALRLATNLHVAQKNSHDWAVSARGFNTDLANKLLVMIDGRTVYTPLFSGVFWDRQDYLLEDIERIEVISGPGGTLWGSNAVNGVINIITKKSNETQRLYAEGGVGSQLENFGGIRYGAQLGKNVFFRLYGKYFERDDAELPDGDDADDSWKMGQVGFRMDAPLSDKNSFTLQGDYYDAVVRLSNGGKSFVTGNNLLGRWSHHFSDNSEFRVQLYYDRTYLSQPVPESRTDDGSVVIAPAGTLTDNLDTYDMDLQHSFSLGSRHRMVWGLGYRRTHDVVHSAPALAFVPEIINRDLYNIYAQDEIGITDKLFVTLGTKVEHNDYTGFEVEPNVRIAFNVTEKQTLWSAVSRAVRIPSRVDAHIRLPTPAFSPFGIDNLLVGNPDFKAENVLAYELGYRAQPGNSLSFSASTFYNVYDDVRSTSLSPPDPVLSTPFPLYYENNLEGETYGVEFTATYQPLEWWRLQGGYTLLEENIRVKKGETDFNNALNETADPQHRFSLQSFTQLHKNISFNAALRYVGAFEYNVSGIADTVSSYTELDVRLAWKITKKLELSVTGQNLLNNRHAEYVISSPNPRAEIERSVYCKLRFWL